MGWRKSLIQLFLTFARRWLVKHATVNVPITHHVLSRLQLPRSQVIYYGVPDGEIEPQSSEIQDDAPRRPVCFGYVGRLVSEKGLPLLLQAAKQLIDEGYTFQLKFIGDGPERAKLQSMVGALGVGAMVKFTGFLQGDVLRTEMADVNAVVMPSVWEETAGLAAMEQMMRGRLVIAAAIGGLGEVVDSAGLKFAPGDVIGLTECMRQVLEHPNFVKQLGAKARARALQRFTMDRMLSEHMGLYHRLLERNENVGT
jgi:glycosyltransferase involved in cell wall biosynthesis